MGNSILWWQYIWQHRYLNCFEIILLATKIATCRSQKTTAFQPMKLAIQQYYTIPLSYTSNCKNIERQDNVHYENCGKSLFLKHLYWGLNWLYWGLISLNSHWKHDRNLPFFQQNSTESSSIKINTIGEYRASNLRRRITFVSVQRIYTAWYIYPKVNAWKA